MKKYNEPLKYIANNEEIADKFSQNFNIATVDLGIKKVVDYTPYENEKYVNLCNTNK